MPSLIATDTTYRSGPDPLMFRLDACTLWRHLSPDMTRRERTLLLDLVDALREVALHGERAGAISPRWCAAQFLANLASDVLMWAVEVPATAPEEQPLWGEEVE